MADDALESVLRMVAEGRLTSAEAGTIIDAMAARPDAGSGRPPPAASAARAGDGGARAIRLEVIENGRKVVNLRVPLALGRAALSRVPGLSEAATDQIREAIEAGISGEIMDVTEGSGDHVRIVIE
jgi:hypothetical protein